MQLPVEITERILEDFERYRMVPTRGISDASSWVYASGDDSRELLDFAEAFSAELEKPVLVVRHPDDGRGIKQLYMVGQKPNEKKGRVR